jgi:HK97 family phage major capsid protein
MAEELKTIVNELGSAFEEFKKANDERVKQIEEKGSADGLLTEKVEKLNAEINRLDEMKSKLDQIETAMAKKSASETDAPSDMDKKAADFEKLMAKRRGIPAAGEFKGSDLVAYKAAFHEWMRKGDHASMDAQKALSVGSDPDGGYLVDPDTTGRIVEKVFESSPMRQVASVQTIGTDALEGVYDLNEAAAGWVSETGSRPETNTPELGKWRIPVEELYANPAATQKVLDDSMVNLEQWLAGKVADKLARVENAAFVNGDGVGKPRGFLTYASGTTLPGTIERFETGVNGGFATGGSGGDVLIDAVYGTKMAYRNGARWFMNRTTTAAVRKIKDSDGMYLWQPGLSAGQPASVLGFPVLEFEDMPDPATDSLSIAFGNMGEAYQIVDRQGIRILRDPYTNKPYVHFYTTRRTGGDVLNFEAIKLIEFTA